MTTRITTMSPADVIPGCMACDATLSAQDHVELCLACYEALFTEPQNQRAWGAKFPMDACKRLKRLTLKAGA